MSTRLRREEASEPELGCQSGLPCLCDSVRPRSGAEERLPAQGRKSILVGPARLREAVVRPQVELSELDAGNAAAPAMELRGKAERVRAPRRRSPVAQPPLEDLLEEARPSSRLDGFARRLWAALRLMVLSVTLGLALSGAVGAGVFGLYRLVLAAR